MRVFLLNQARVQRDVQALFRAPGFEREEVVELCGGAWQPEPGWCLQFKFEIQELPFDGGFTVAGFPDKDDACDAKRRGECAGDTQKSQVGWLL